MKSLFQEFEQVFNMNLNDFLNFRLYQYNMLVIESDILEDSIREVNQDFTDDSLENLIIKYYGEKGLNLYYKLL